MALIAIGNLTNNQIDWAVASEEGTLPGGGALGWPTYSTVWNLAGPILVREKINLYWQNSVELWFAEKPSYNRTNFVSRSHASAALPMAAALRCFLADAVGDEVDIPESVL